jgi:hypothetical protein
LTQKSVGDAEIARIAATLSDRAAELAKAMIASIRSEVDFYRDTAVISDDTLQATAMANFAFIFSGLSGQGSFDTSPATSTGEQRAQAGAPLPAVMAGFRVGSRTLWQALLDIADSDSSIDPRALLGVASRIWEAQDVYTEAMVAGYRRRATQEVLDDEAEKAALTEALLDGRLSAQASLWEVADLLRLPTRGPYVVVAAQAPSVGKQPLPGIAAKLRSVDVHSAWRLLPDQQIGIAHVPSEPRRAQLLEILRRSSSGRVGVSQQFDDLAETAAALRHARLALNGRGDPTEVMVFDDSVLAIAAVMAPETDIELAASVLGSLQDLPAEDKGVLFETFRAWMNHRGSHAAAAAELFCHPNTVRYRLRRIEESTGRDLSAPRELAELCLAFEIDAKLR